MRSWLAGTSFIVSNAGSAANTAYYYRVSAVNGAVYSSYSNVANAKATIASFTIPLYRGGTPFGTSCMASNNVIISSGCSGAPIGYISASTFSGAVPLYRGGTMFDTSCMANYKATVDPECSATPIGYVSSSLGGH